MKSYIRYLLILSLISTVSAIIYFVEYYPYKGTDDAHIYFQYAKNFTKGYGFSYMPSGEKVEGFTSMLWLLITIFFYSISTSGFHFMLMGVNLLLISYAVHRMLLLLESYFPSANKKWLSLPSAIFLALLLVPKGYLDWTIFSLLETGLWSTLLITLSCLILEECTSQQKPENNRYLFPTLIGLLILTRPESVLLGLFFVALSGWVTWIKTKNARAVWLRIQWPFLVYVLTTIALILFRLWYFGYPFPNTYYAKVSTDLLYNIKEGLIYFLKYIIVYPFHLLPAILAFVSIPVYFLRDKFKANPAPYELLQICNALITIVFLFLPLLTGGDHFPLFRSYQPMIPVFFLLFFNLPFYKGTFDRLKSPDTRRGLGYLVLIIVAVFAYLTSLPKYGLNTEKMPYKTSMLSEFTIAENGKEESYKLNQFFNFHPKPSIGRVAVGGSAFGYDGSTVDLMGLNNTLMAHAIKKKVGLKNHAAFDKNTFYKLKVDLMEIKAIPDTTGFLLPENTPGFDKSFNNFVLKNLFRDEKFISLYKPVIINHPSTNASFFSYVLNDYCDTLKAKGYSLRILNRSRTYENEYQ